VSLLLAATEQGSVVRLDPALDRIVSPDAKLEPLADAPGRFTREGPVWLRDGGYLIYTVRNGNRHAGSPPPTDSDVVKWDPRTGAVSLFVPSLKSDGNTVDPKGRIVSAVNIGTGQIVRVEKDGKRTVLVDQYQGRPINPNDLVFRSDGSLYFSSPPRFKSNDTPSVFMLRDGKLDLLTTDIKHPGGLAFTPDEKHLYIVDNPQIAKLDVSPDGTIANARVFFDMSDQKPLANSPDGLKVDTEGNVYVTGPFGIWIISPEGKHLGTILEPHRPANLAFGGPDGKTLFITSRPGLSRIQLKVAGRLP
jgi:gluconolactonase